MCQCGCGDFAADYQLPGPDGVVYTLRMFRGCDNCRIPAGVVVGRFTAEEAPRWHADRLPALDLSGDCDERLLPVLDPEKLKKRMVQFAKANGTEYDPDGLVEDAVDHTFSEAVMETMNGARAGRLAAKG
jgi:hypothetical protein